LISRQLIEAIGKQYRLSWDGVHGIGHWARVRENGLRIAATLPGVNPGVVELFAVFHDAGRRNESIDAGHGRRGARLAKGLRGVLFELSDAEFALLDAACRYHTDGRTEGDVTVQTCWDADRLDLGRVDIQPDPRYLCTAAAKDPDLMAWADGRARQRVVPQFAVVEWIVDRWFDGNTGSSKKV
jgi:uncharacterized protein